MVPPKFAKVYLKLGQLKNEAPKLTSPSNDPLGEKAKVVEKEVLNWLERRFNDPNKLLERGKRRHNISDSSSSTAKFNGFQEMKEELSNFSKKRPVWLMGAEPKSHSEKMKENNTIKHERYPWSIENEKKDLGEAELSEAFAVTDIPTAIQWAEKYKRTLGALQWILKVPYEAEKGMTPEEAANTKLGRPRFERYVQIAEKSGWNRKSRYFTNLFPTLNSDIQTWINDNIRFDRTEGI